MAYMVKWKKSDWDVRTQNGKNKYFVLREYQFVPMMGRVEVSRTEYEIGIGSFETDDLDEALEAYNLRRRWGIQAYILLDGKLFRDSRKDDLMLKAAAAIKHLRVTKIIENGKQRVAERLHNAEHILDDDFVSDLDFDVDEIGHEVDGADYADMEGGED